MAAAAAAAQDPAVSLDHIFATDPSAAALLAAAKRVDDTAVHPGQGLLKATFEMARSTCCARCEDCDQLMINVMQLLVKFTLGAVKCQDDAEDAVVAYAEIALLLSGKRVPGISKRFPTISAEDKIIIAISHSVLQGHKTTPSPGKLALLETLKLITDYADKAVTETSMCHDGDADADDDDDDEPECQPRCTVEHVCGAKGATKCK